MSPFGALDSAHFVKSFKSYFLPTGFNAFP